MTEIAGGGNRLESYEHTHTQHIDLSADWIDDSRWQAAAIAGFGLTIDRATISLQRSWSLSNIIEGGGSDLFIFGCILCGGGYGNYPDGHLQQTSLRFAYRLF